jgi:mono/diheme cytochrome c family protein
VNTAPNARTALSLPPAACALLAAGALAALLAAGCAKRADRAAGGGTPAATSAASTSSGAAHGDAARGKTLFAAHCAMCHGQASTPDAIGPPLANERKRKSYAQTVAAIEEPRSPMPKLYPDTLTAKDVADVAAYVQTL